MRGEGAANLGWQYGAQTRRLVTFSLEGKGTLAKLAPRALVKPIAAPDFKVDEAKAQKGAQLFLNCEMCHGPMTLSGGVAPDLRASATVLSPSAFQTVLRSGALRSKGMPDFANYSDTDLENLRHFIRQQAEVALKGH
jgi:quinohemoprotein ethanol dehydrogenase